ncbi:MAG: ankyrin repeat domain-containing protein, partial [bacterium]|nr:ankyrin repeat domain-containing protein [bacterium]
MDFINELNKVINSELIEFKKYIKKQIEADADFLEHPFWVAKDGAQMTLLNYLIHLYPESKVPTGLEQTLITKILNFIEYILPLVKDKNAGEPIHQAVAAEKTQLALHLLGGVRSNSLKEDEPSRKVVNLLANQKPIEQEGIAKQAYLFDVNRRDKLGRSLLSLVVDSKNVDLLVAVLNYFPNIHVATYRTAAQVQFQPLHQAIVLDFADGIRLLAHRGAQLANPYGSGKDTPVLLAARLVKIAALTALLEQPIEQLKLEAENGHLNDDNEVEGRTAIEEFCERINSKDKIEAIQGIAMLLCRGAEPPRQEALCSLLANNRIALLKAIHLYLEDKPELVDSFVARCHLSQSALHNIVYASHSWGNSIRHLFGSPSEAAFIVEELMVRKYTTATNENVHPMSIAAAEQVSPAEDPLKLYALFVRRYTEAYNSQTITNAW